MNCALPVMFALIPLVIPSRDRGGAGEQIQREGSKHTNANIKTQGSGRNHGQQNKQTKMQTGFQALARYKVGVGYRWFTVNGPYNWRAAKTHGLHSVIWYPADAATVEQD